jgi:hypothetical protein
VNEEETKTMEFLGPGDRLLPTHTILEYPKMALFSNLSMQPFLNRMGIDSRVGRALNQLRTGFESANITQTCVSSLLELTTCRYSLKHLLNRITAQVVMTLPAALDPDGQAVFTEAVGQAIALPLTYMAEHEAALRAVLLQESSVIATLQEVGRNFFLSGESTWVD